MINQSDIIKDAFFAGWNAASQLALEYDYDVGGHLLSGSIEEVYAKWLKENNKQTKVQCFHPHWDDKKDQCIDCGIFGKELRAKTMKDL